MCFAQETLNRLNGLLAKATAVIDGLRHMEDSVTPNRNQAKTKQKPSKKQKSLLLRRSYLFTREATAHSLPMARQCLHHLTLRYQVKA